MVIGVKALADLAENGRIERAHTLVQAIHLPATMQNTLRDYQQYCKDRLYLRPSTLLVRTRALTIFLDFLHSKKERALDQIQAADLSEFVSCQDRWRPKTVMGIVRLLGAVDRSSAKGKRDYAILLLACRLGCVRGIFAH